MMPPIPLAIPSYAGVCTPEETRRQGFSVAEATRRLRRLAFVQRRLASIAAAHLNCTPEWEVKSALALHAWLDIEHADQLRLRLLELRENEARAVVADPALAAFMDEILFASGAGELLSAIYEVVRPLMLQAIEDYLRETNPLADQPSCRILKIIRMEENETLAWGRAAVQALRAAVPNPQNYFYVEHLRAYLGAAGGIDGRHPEQGSRPLPPPRAAQPFVPDLTPRRDARFHGLYDTSIPADTVYNDESRGIDERNLALLFKRVREMDVPEVIAGILCETPNRSGEYYRDMFRQMWDESRHALLGQAALEARGVDWTSLPINVTFSYKMAKFLQAPERHILLYAIEQSLMSARTGKRYEYDIAFQSGDALSATFHDFDWADEVLHAAIGRRHLRSGAGVNFDAKSEVIFKDQSEILRQAEQLVERIAHRLQDDDIPRDAPPEDWWERFAEKTLGHPVEKVKTAHLSEWRPVSS